MNRLQVHHRHVLLSCKESVLYISPARGLVSWLGCSSITGNHNEDHFNYPQVVGSELMWFECVDDLQGVLLPWKDLGQSGHGMAATFGRGLLA